MTDQQETTAMTINEERLEPGPINKERLELGLADLISGEYHQGQRHLRGLDDKYCCLGVMCDRYRKETGDGEWCREEKEWGDQWVFRCGDGGARAGILPAPVRDWYGFSTSNPVLPERGRRTRGGYASSWNDGGASFAQIEQAFRAQYLAGEES